MFFGVTYPIHRPTYDHCVPQVDAPGQSYFGKADDMRDLPAVAQHGSSVGNERDATASTEQQYRQPYQQPYQQQYQQGAPPQQYGQHNYSQVQASYPGSYTQGADTVRSLLSDNCCRIQHYLSGILEPCKYAFKWQRSWLRTKK